MSDIFFAHPYTLLDKIQEVLKKVGPEKFFSDPSEELKKAREGFAGYFFTLTLKKMTGRDWWLAQFEREFPDFDLMSFTEKPEDMALERIELVTVPDRCKNFEEMMSIVQSKLTGYSNPENVNLLIFINHVKSEEWVKLLNEGLTDCPFKNIWTIHLLFKNGKEVKKAVANKIRPLPALRIEADTDERGLHIRQPLPEFLEEIKKDGRRCVVPKSDFINEFRKMVMRARLKLSKDRDRLA